ncbi:NPCBM/NEW2 domain-containing protein [Planctomycetota bacterium]
MLSAQQKKKLYVLIDGLCENTLSDTQFEQLDRWLRTDPDARKIYIHYVQMWVDLPYLHETLQTHVHSPTTSLTTMLSDHDWASGNLSDSAIWQALLEIERTAPGIVPIETKPKQEVSVKKADTPASSMSNRFWLVTALVSAAALFLILLLPFFVTPPKEVATLTDSMNVEWFEPENAIATGQRLSTRSPLRIENNGIVKLECDNGAKIIIEGPAAFEFIDTNQISLYAGRFSVRASGAATGFTAYTPTSCIVDLGTEFGVEVLRDGITHTHMFEGKASLAANKEGISAAISLLSPGQAKQIDGAGQLTDIAFKGRTFVREMNSRQGFVWRGEPIDLGDVFLNGDGWGSGTITETAIASSPIMDLPTLIVEGAITDTYRPEYDPQDPCYYAVDHPYIDGVFIPDGGNHPVQVSSLGHVYRDCPDTRGVTWKSPLLRETDRSFDEVVIGNTTFRKAIVLHSNLGVTFDLDVIRQTLPGISITQFQCLLDMQKRRKAHSKGWDYVAHMDVFVLLDGQERLRRNGVTPADDAIPVAIPIQPQERFLTLMVTNGDDESIDLDYGVFAEARLTLNVSNDS